MTNSHAPIPAELSIAVLLPCYNEGSAIHAVVTDFKKQLPGAVVYVYDNNSTDETRAEAKRAGAVVRTERHQGKGHVVRRMFADIDADIYVMADGDGTYDASSAGRLINLLLTEHLDMVVGSRKETAEEAYRRGHRFGNRLLTGLVRAFFGAQFQDMLSGYRVFSRRFVKTFPANARGFEIETELTVHAIELRLPCCESPTEYGARAEGTVSKLNTYRDGLRILMMVLRLLFLEKPRQLFTVAGLLPMLGSIALAVPIVSEWLETGLVPRLPSTVLCTGLMLVGFLLVGFGMLLSTLTMSRREAKRLAYLAIPALPCSDEALPEKRNATPDD